MENIMILVIGIILVFGVAISYALKVEKQFDYYKIIFPDKLERYTSMVDMQAKMKFIDSTLGLMIYLPIFTGRVMKEELNNEKLRKIASKITKYVYSFWIFVFAFIVFVLTLNFI